MSSGDKNQIQGLEGDSILRDWVDRLLEMSREKEEKDKDKIVRLHQDSSKILRLLGLKPSIPFPETGTDLDVLHEELEQIQVEVFKLQAAQGVVSKLLPPGVQRIQKEVVNDWAIRDWVFPNDTEVTEEAATAGEASPFETCSTGEDKEEVGMLKAGNVQGSEIDDNTKEEEEAEEDEENIVPLTTAEVDQSILYQHHVLQNLVPLVQGKSLEGKTLPQLLNGIPTTPSLVISVANYLDVTLEQPEIFHTVDIMSNLSSSLLASRTATSITSQTPATGLSSLNNAGVSSSGESITIGNLSEIQSRTTEIVRVKSRTPGQVTDKISGILGYKIPNTDRKLFINFEVLQHGVGVTHIGLSLGPDHLPAGEDARYYIWYQTGYNTFRPDTRRNGKEGLPGQIVVSSDNLCAWGEISGGSKATLKVAIWSKDTVNGLLQDWKPKIDEVARFIGPVRKPFACKLVLDNLLKMDLLEDDFMLKSGVPHGDISSVLRPSETESLLVSGSKSAEGLLFYKIGRTDIKLAIAFWILPTHSSFALSFTKEASVCNSEFLKMLSTNLKEWTRSHYTLASPSDGEQQIRIRNLVAKAVMSNAHGASNYSCHSLLKVSIQVQKSPSTE